MDRGKSRSRPTLGDMATDFMAQWNASQADKTPANVEPERGTIEHHGGVKRVKELPSWKRGGGEVKVTRGRAAGFKNRQKRTDGKAPGKKPLAPPAHTDVGILAPRRAPQPPPVPAPKPLRQRLREASADMCDLRIGAAMSCPRGSVEFAPVVEDEGGRLAILGLDFGTAFTKAVVRWSGRHYAVDWSDAVEGEDRHLLASAFSEAPDGQCVLGARHESGWLVHEGIKLQLLSSTPTTSDDSMVNAVVFIALAFRHVHGWLRRTSRETANGMRWRLHVGLPARSWDDDATTERFKLVAQAARVLACAPGLATRVGALEALRMTKQIDRPAVDVLPEFACQLYSYLLSPERGEDLHALVDIGAGTLDVSYFNVFVKDGEPLLPIFASAVEALGVHYLIAALSGRAGRSVWADGESSLSDEEVGRKLDCLPGEVSNRRSLYLSSVAGVFNEATCAARAVYPTSPAVQGKDHVRLFLCGGGSRVSSLRKRFERIATESARLMGIKFQVSELVKPRDMVGQLDSGFDRLSVAYGLSQNAANIGQVMRSATLEPVMPRERFSERHRDDDR